MVNNNLDEEYEEDYEDEEIEELTDEELESLDDDDLGDLDNLDEITGNLMQAAPLMRNVSGDTSEASDIEEEEEDEEDDDSEESDIEEDEEDGSEMSKKEETPEDQTNKKGTTKQVTLDTIAETFKPKPETFIIPNDPCFHVKRTKTGLTIPKEVRESIPDDQHFSMVVKDNQIIFYYINEEDIPKLNLIRKPSSESKKKGKGGRKKRRIVKKPVGPQPEWGNYFLFEFENQDKIQEVLTTAFEKYANKTPDLEEGMRRIKFALTNFMTNQRMNDFRVRQAVSFFICDIAIKFNIPDLIDFVIEKIQPDIKSKFLKQLNLNQLIYTCFNLKQYEKVQELISQALETISKSSEEYAIMDSFKNLVVRITRGVTFNVPKEYIEPIKDALITYYEQLDDFDYRIQIIENLERLEYKEEALDIANKIKSSLEEEDAASHETIDELIKSIKEKKVKLE
jgi:hypothetical protein